MTLVQLKMLSRYHKLATEYALVRARKPKTAKRIAKSLNRLSLRIVSV